MKRKKNLSTVPWTPFERATVNGKYTSVADKLIGKPKQVWMNSRYQVIEYPPEHYPEVGRVVWLSLRAIDRSARHDWREMQRIKNELVGPEYDAVEIYPAESKLVDGANQYHLWVFLDSQIPFGFHVRVVSDGKWENSKQRPFEERPADCQGPVETQALIDKAVEDVKRRGARERASLDPPEREIDVHKREDHGRPAAEEPQPRD